MVKMPFTYAQADRDVNCIYEEYYRLTLMNG